MRLKHTRPRPEAESPGEEHPPALGRARMPVKLVAGALAVLLLLAISGGAAALLLLPEGSGSEAEDLEELKSRLLRDSLSTAELPPGFQLSEQFFESNEDAARQDLLEPYEQALQRHQANGRILGLESRYLASDASVLAQPGAPLFQVTVITNVYKDKKGARSAFDYRKQNQETLKRNTAIALDALPQFDQVRILTSPVPEVGEDRFSFHLEARLTLGETRLPVLYEYITFLRGRTLDIVVAATVGAPSPSGRLLALRLDEKLVAGKH